MHNVVLLKRSVNFNEILFFCFFKTVTLLKTVLLRRGYMGTADKRNLQKSAQMPNETISRRQVLTQISPFTVKLKISDLFPRLFFAIHLYCPASL